MRARTGADVPHGNALVGSGLRKLAGGKRSTGLEETAAVDTHVCRYYTALAGISIAFLLLRFRK
jgi:hypothetical protein